MSSVAKAHKAIGFIGVFLACLWFIYNFNFGEINQEKNGLGYDGSLYAEWTQKNPIELLQNGALNQFEVQKVLLPLVIHFIAKAIHYPLDDTAQLVKAFYIFDCFILICGFLIVNLIAKELQWSMPIRFLAYTSLFCNFAILKATTYFPILLDDAGFFIGLLTIYFYLRENTLGLVCIMILGSFVIPSISYATCPLVIFKIRKQAERVSLSRKPNNVLPALFGLTVVTMAFCLHRYGIHNPNLLILSMLSNAVLPLTLTCLFLYLFFALRPFFDLKYVSSMLRQSLSWLRFFWVAVLVFGLHMIPPLLSKIPNMTFVTHIKEILLQTLVHPFLGLVIRAMYFGPLVILLLFIWKDFVAYCKEKGLGLFLYIFLYIFLSIGAEARQDSNAWPVFAVIACEILNRRKASWQFCYPMMIISIILSRFWLNLNVGVWDGKLLEFPQQMFFMNTGPWTNTMMYAVFFGVLVIVGIAIYALMQMLPKESVEQNVYNKETAGLNP